MFGFFMRMINHRNSIDFGDYITFTDSGIFGFASWINLKQKGRKMSDYFDRFLNFPREGKKRRNCTQNIRQNIVLQIFLFSRQTTIGTLVNFDNNQILFI